MQTDYIKNIDNAERRMISEQVELREENEQRFMEGYAFKFGAIADLGSFTEEIAPGAADGVMNDDVRGLFNHDPNLVLGRNKAGTMTLSVDAVGMRYAIKHNPNDPDHVSVSEKIKRGDVTQSSFAFRVKDDKWETRNGKEHRTILKFSRLIDVSPVTYAAYNDATVALRSLSNIVNNKKDLAEMDQQIMRQELNLK
ncbi:MAG TPA: HK97 family phage prohead protease [Ohtaekwangia sp.]|nr:HK97 family phage prohead protease [Ohtaekwangia sp.]